MSRVDDSLPPHTYLDDVDAEDEDPGEELEAMIEQADRPFASDRSGPRRRNRRKASPSTNDWRRNGRRGRPLDVQLAIEDFDAPDEEKQLVGQASFEHDPFVAPEEAAMTVRDAGPGAVDHPEDPEVESDGRPIRGGLSEMTETECRPSRDAVAARDGGTRLRAPSTPGPEGLARGLPGSARDPGLLPGGLEPGLLRPDGAVPGVLPEFQKFGAELLGISVDGVWSHLAFAKDRNLHFPLLADFEPKGEVARAYQVYRAKDGTSERALFVIDADGHRGVELRLAGRREPRRRRDPPRARGPQEGGVPHEHDPVGGRAHPAGDEDATTSRDRRMRR